MYVKHKTGAALVAASIGVATVVSAGLATAEPCPGGKNCQSTTAAATPAPQQTHESTPAPAQTETHQPTPTATQTETHESTPAPTTTSQPSKPAETSAPQTTQPSERGHESRTSETSATSATPTTTEHSDHDRGSKSSETSATSSAPTTTQHDHPKPPPFTPKGQFERGNAQVGGPTDLPHGFSAPGHGAPPPPPQRGPGWNDGPAPDGPPPNWDGPPPPGGWNSPQPPPGGWNRRYDHPGPPRDVDHGRRDFGYFDYNGFSVVPTFNPWYGGWGYWYFGLWVPLY